MKNQLPIKRNITERGIINLDDSKNPRTHWCAYIKDKNVVYWFDPFGDVPPPEEIVQYFKNFHIFYNHDKFQYFGTSDCGKLSLEFLSIYKTRLFC